jgi:hypothetical protein
MDGLNFNLAFFVVIFLKMKGISLNDVHSYSLRKHPDHKFFWTLEQKIILLIIFLPSSGRGSLLGSNVTLEKFLFLINEFYSISKELNVFRERLQ